MKICLFGNATSIHIQRWASWFAGKGHEVHVFTFMDGKIENVNIHYINIKLKHVPFAQLLSLPLEMQKVKRAIREINPDIVHGHYLTNYGLYAACSGFHPLVVSAWGSDVLIVPRQDLLARVLTKYTLKKADYVTCPSETLKKGLLKLGTGLGKIRIIQHGVDTQQFNPQQKSKEINLRLGISGNPTVICIRNFRPVYNVEMLIKAIPLVLEQVPAARFILAGDGEQKNYLNSLANSLGVSDNIRFVGWISHNELPEYLSSSDVYVSTSLSDGTSISLHEAMACELAPVVTDLPANREWVTDGENGFIVPINDAHMLADRIVYLLRNKEIRERFGKSGRKIIVERAEHEKEMAKMEKIYQEIVEKQ